MFHRNHRVSENDFSARPGKGIAFKLSFWILLCATLIFAGVLGYYYSLSRQLILEEIEKDSGQLARGTANHINGILAATEKIPESLSIFISEQKIGDKQKLLALMEAILKQNTDIYGTAVAFEPYMWDSKVRRFGPYLYRGKEGISSTLIPYDYFSWNWYKLPRQFNSSTWIEPYFDEGAGNIIMSTYSVPFYRNVKGEKKFAGIVTIDISLDWLQKIAADIRIGKTGYAFLISKNGTFVTHPDSRLIMNKTIFSVAEERNDPQLREVGKRMMEGQTGFVKTESLTPGKNCWLAYTSLPSSGWSLGILFPEDELMADVSRLYFRALIMGAIGFIFLFGVIVWIARGITRPLHILASSAATMAGGDLNVPIPDIHTRDEVGRLASSFSTMQSSLKTYIRDLTETTAAKERIESELKVAHNIQMGILPRVFPPFPERPEIDIYATLRPAKEVGGDLYDYFFMDEDHLCFTVGDVSGKGVPAAILMAVTKILIKAKATQGLAPETIISRANEDLSLDNPSMMFVTLFLGILNVRNGELIYCNAGHPPPYIIRADGRIEALPTTNGMALGVMEDFVYRSKTVMLQKQDSLFLFSDGVTEANDAQYELFAEPRLEAALADLKNQGLKDILTAILERIDSFAKDTPQADDITMLIVQYYGNPLAGGARPKLKSDE